MKRLLVTLALASLVLPATALGKGPSAATMDGPGGGGGITFGGDESSGPLGDLTQQSGWFAGAFEEEGAGTSRPKGDLGPKYAVTYSVLGPNNDTFTIRQDIYPYAKSGPVTYMAAGQPIFDFTTRGGWYQAGPELKTTLVSAGLPASPPVGGSDDRSFPTVAVTTLVLMLLAITAGALLVRRRARPAAA